MSYTDHNITAYSDPGPRYLRVYEDGRDSIVVDSDGNAVDEKWRGFIVKDGEVHHMPDEFPMGGFVHKSEAIVPKPVITTEFVLRKVRMGEFSAAEFLKSVLHIGQSINQTGQSVSAIRVGEPSQSKPPPERTDPAPKQPKQPQEPTPTNDDWWKWGEYGDGQ